MKRTNEIDALRNEKWADVYADVPGAVQLGVQRAFERIRARERMRKRTVRALACAACLALIAGAAGLFLRPGVDAPDRVAAPKVELQTLNAYDVVYAARADACFHVRPDCSSAMAEQVELQLETALEFRKTLCPVCGANVRLEEDK